VTTERRLTWFDAFRDACFGLVDGAALPTGALALARAPKGDGHAVLVFPGFLSTDQPTALLRWFLTQAGYRAYPWMLGTNYGLSHEHAYDLEALIEHRLKEVFIESGDRKISLIGWSLGGVYAKELARRHPQLIREVITLGSPISGNATEISVWRIYEWVTQTRLSEPGIARKLRALARPLEGVPITAFYCKADGFVPWKNACETPGALVQNIEVKASHVGMGFDAFTYYLIAHRLARSAAKRWQSLDVAALWKRFRSERVPV
jgi:pimeloyl-ACP methyl ester carboxylesterase